MRVAITRKRNAFIAGLFSAACPGLGFLYVGKLLYALALPLGLTLVFALSAWTRVIFSPAGMLGAVLVYFSIWIVSIVFAVFIARRQGEVALKWMQRWYVYVGFFVLSSIVGSILLNNRGNLFGYETYRFSAQSMADTILVGDFIITDTWKYRSNVPQRGDLIVFRYPRDPSVKYIKRVIGLPGDLVEIRDYLVYVNGKSLDEPYVKLRSNERLSNATTSYQVPSDGYFMMGDNRDNSNDSRFWGPLPSENIYGSVEFIWLSYDPIAGLRLDRIGKFVK
ncbi:MAG TPA: signal peptidase I [Gammaproteobacteria bacterium]|nr:signal peptidase I [Gammaproteobacteria bacterium]